MRRLIFRVFTALLTLATGIMLAHVGQLSFASFIDQSSANLIIKKSVQTPPLTREASPPAPPAPRLKRVEGLKIQSNSISEAVGDFYSIEAEYPQIAGFDNAAVRRFNLWLKNLVGQEIAEFRKMAVADMRERQRRREDPLLGLSLSIGYEVIFSSRNLMSLRLTLTVMTPGQMHPIDYYESINYDLNRARSLRLRDLFKPEAKYLQAISRYCLDELGKKYERQGFQPEGVEPVAENFKNWNITPEGIFISFEDYQVGPHSMGQPEIIVPYHILEDLMTKKRARFGLE